MKIAFFALNQNFCGDILEELRAWHTVRLWKKVRDPAMNWANIMGLLNWCDLAYFDFIQEPFPEITQLQHLERSKPFIVTRMDGIDILNHDSVDWRKVDALVLMPVQEKRLERLRTLLRESEKLNLPPLPKRILRRNVGIDLKLFTPDYHVPGYSIVLHSSVIRETKRVYTAIQLFYELITEDRDRPWTLTVIGQWAGGWQWPKRLEYVMCVGELIESLDFPKDRLFIQMQNFSRPQWAEYIRKRDVYWCTSFREGFPNSMGEAAASGVWPISNWFYGAERIYPAENLCKTPGDVIDKTIAWGQLEKDAKRLQGMTMRKWMEQFDRHKTAVEIRELCEEVAAG